MQAIEVTAQEHHSGDPKALKTGWLRVTLRTGLAFGMISQLVVLSDLGTTIRGG